jgi:polysaccharide pyruvyl transferase WcaK-like protein
MECVTQFAQNKKTNRRIRPLGTVIAKNILILAGDTDGNLGDLAIVTATCERLRKIRPGAQISMLTSHPDRDSRRLGIVPLRRGLRGIGSLLRAARQADLVICGGGGLFQDDDSLLKMPYWGVRLACLRLFARRIVGLSIGAGPLRHPVSRLFARLAMKALRPATVRDPLALAVLQPLTRTRIRVVPDPAFILQASASRIARQVLKDAGVPADKPLVGVAVRRWFHTNSNLIPHTYAVKVGLNRNRGSAKMWEFNELTAAVLTEVVSHAGAHVVFMPTYNVRHENDAAVCEKIASKMPGGSSTILDLDDPKLYKAVTGLLSVMLCGRMHPAILAAGQGIPIVGLSYNQKFPGTFSMLGHGTRCLSMTEFVDNRDTARLSAMLREAIRRPADFTPDTTAVQHVISKFIEELVAPSVVVRVTRPEPQTQHN